MILKLKNKKKPLDKINILDIGCGGGLLSEPMQRLGSQCYWNRCFN